MTHPLPRMAAAAILLATAAAGVAGAGPEPTLPPGFDRVFTGALVSTYPDGLSGKLWVSPDGTFIGQGRHGGRDAGRWTLSNGRVCMVQTRPIPAPLHYCTPLPRSLANPWPAKAATGEAITLHFVAGDRP